MNLPPPYEDILTGACLRLGRAAVLLTGDGWQQAIQVIGSHRELLLSGPLALRYGFRHLYLADDALIPQMVYDDHRREHTGRELFDFVAARGHAYPRADVIGLRASGGEAHVLLRELDLAEPLLVIASGHDQPDGATVRVGVAVLLSQEVNEWTPLGEDSAVRELPDLLVQHVPAFRLNPAHAAGLPALLSSWLPAHS